MAFNTYLYNLKHYLFSHRPLDYENLVRHTLVISAKDGGSPSLSANLTLSVDVQDVNDNPPVFEHDAYSASVLESEALNTKVKIGNRVLVVITARACVDFVWFKSFH